MLTCPRSSRLASIGLGVFVVLFAILVFSSTPPADAEPARAASLVMTTATPTPSVSPTPTPTPDPSFPQMTDIACNPTLTADAASVGLLDQVTFTFDDGCVCASDFACGFYPWNATLSSRGFALTEQFGNPPPTTFTATAVSAGGEIDITVNYFGEKQVGGFYFTSNLSASTQLVVEPIITPPPTPTITPTPTATPTPTYVYPVVVCEATLTASNDTPAVGEAVTFTFDADCTCPIDPSRACTFSYFARDYVGGEGFDFSDVELGRRAQGPIVGIATVAGPTEVSVQYYGETYNGIQYHWAYQRASVSLTIEPPVASPAFACEQRGVDLSWTDADVGKYWIYRTVPDQPAKTWIGRTLGETIFTDPNPVAGATYLVHYAGIPRTPCADLGGPIDPGPTLTCSVEAGVVTWNDTEQPKYWIYRSTPDGPAFVWLGRAIDEATFTDPSPVIGARYQVRFAGAAPFECSVSSEPSNPPPAFMCSEANGYLDWTDHDQTKYWVYRSVDDGQTYTWLGRTRGATTFTDESPADDALYQVHYEGIPRVDCGLFL